MTPPSLTLASNAPSSGDRTEGTGVAGRGEDDVAHSIPPALANRAKTRDHAYGRSPARRTP